MTPKLMGFSGLSHVEFLAKGEYILMNIETHRLAQGDAHPPFVNKGEVTEAFCLFRDLQHASNNKDVVTMAKRDQARKVAEEKLENFGNYMLMKANGDVTQMLGSGYDVVPPRAPKKPISVNEILLAPITLSARHLIVNGQPAPRKIVLKWTSIHGASAYQVQMTEDPSAEANWTTIMHTSHCREEVEGESAKRCYFRVRVLSGQSFGPWSEPVNILFL
ncbi:hypothetical protein GMLC_19330 [Geomonas limicola]|uniref:Fibronectin type-III domain-containing protein n=1 Tax=Geomonas limicola TaxID=2740186 RepID=A0A6V8N8Z3_9BACT|nr:hypothetical protein [Geomonas limicola]GFO68354.1 hypothetical protein GMLC_19330 [Geomonas limicola]